MKTATITTSDGFTFAVVQGNTDKLHLCLVHNINTGRYPGKAICSSQTSVGCFWAQLPEMDHTALADYISERLCSKCYKRIERKIEQHHTVKLNVL